VKEENLYNYNSKNDPEMAGPKVSIIKRFHCSIVTAHFIVPHGIILAPYLYRGLLTPAFVTCSSIALVPQATNSGVRRPEYETVIMLYLLIDIFLAYSHVTSPVPSL